MYVGTCECVTDEDVRSLGGRVTGGCELLRMVMSRIQLSLMWENDSLRDGGEPCVPQQSKKWVRTKGKTKVP